MTLLILNRGQEFLQLLSLFPVFIGLLDLKTPRLCMNECVLQIEGRCGSGVREDPRGLLLSGRSYKSDRDNDKVTHGVRDGTSEIQ